MSNTTLKAGYGKLAISLVIDAIGMGSCAIPALGDIADAIIAPISFMLILIMYGNIGFATLGFVDEIMPCPFDVFPSATFAWIYTNYLEK